MKQRTIRIIKIGLGAYLTFIGSVHFINIYDQKPSDMFLQIMIALCFLIAGITYMVWDVRKLVERILKEKAELAAQKEAEERKRRYQELHSSDKFRTAPMRVIKPIHLEKEEATVHIKWSEQTEALEKEQVSEQTVASEKEKISEQGNISEKEKVSEQGNISEKEKVSEQGNISEKIEEEAE